MSRNGLHKKQVQAPSPAHDNEGDVDEQDELIGIGDDSDEEENVDSLGMDNGPTLAEMSRGQPPPPKRQMRVLRDFPTVIRGQRVTLRIGKVIDDLSYDIDALLRQGVPLEAVPPA